MANSLLDRVPNLPRAEDLDMRNMRNFVGPQPLPEAMRPNMRDSVGAQPQPQPSRAEKPASGGAAPRNKGGRGESLERAPRAEKSAKPAKEEPRIPETDDSLQLIARKAPAQKYASFDDYMKAHED